MARPIWKGHISFGLVNIPVTLYSAEQRNEFSLKMIDGRNNAAIRYERVNDLTGEEVPWDEIVKGYEYEDGRFVLLTDEDLKAAAPEKTQTIEIESFVPTDAIAPQYFDKPYYLVPGKNADKAYALLREALRTSGRLGIARVVIRTRQYLAAISSKDSALVLDLLRFHHELREVPADKLPGEDLEKLKISDKELQLAEQLIDAMAKEWAPEEYQDEYRDKLLSFIEKKAEGGLVSVGATDDDEAEAPANVIDMMSLLKKSMERNRGGSTKEGEDTEDEDKRASS